MNNSFIIRAKKLITVSDQGTILDGAMAISNEKIIEVGKWLDIKKKYPRYEVIDVKDKVITPGLVDCHTHLLEFAPTSLYPITKETHFIASKAILLNALDSGITAIGEQICGHPLCDFSIDDYRASIETFPIDVSFAMTSITIGFADLVHFTSVTKSKEVNQSQLTDPSILKEMALHSDYPGENIFINATPANFPIDEVPRAGELIYSLDELKQIVRIFHHLNKQIGVHVAGIKGIDMALEGGVDVLHHAHGITDEQIKKVKTKKIKIVATPLGGTHLEPNSPENIMQLVMSGVPVSIATDSYLPPYIEADWLTFRNRSLKGSDVFMLISHPSMKILYDQGLDENEVLALITANPAHILGKERQFGKLDAGMEANFLIANGIPGLEITNRKDIKGVFFKGKQVIQRE